MSRLVRVPKRASDDLAIAGLEDMLPHGLGGAEDQQIATETDNYLERIAKYVPGEVLAFFIFINIIVEQAVKTGGKSAAMAGVPVTTVAQGALVVGLLLTPLFVWYVREEGDAWLTNAFVSGFHSGLCAGRRRLQRLLGRQPGGDPARDLHGGERPDLAAHPRDAGARRRKRTRRRATTDRTST
jgi:hypothetical protein